MDWRRAESKRGFLFVVRFEFKFSLSVLPWQILVNSEVRGKEHVAQLGDEITIRRFVRFQVGESA